MRGREGKRGGAAAAPAAPTAWASGDKAFFRIGEVAAIVGVEPHVLRFWEGEFRGLRPSKASGQRVYRRRDVELLLKIKQLVHVERFTLAGARQRLAEAPEAVTPAAPSGLYLARRSLEAVRRAVAGLRAALAPEDPQVSADPLAFCREMGIGEGARGRGG